MVLFKGICRSALYLAVASFVLSGIFCRISHEKGDLDADLRRMSEGDTEEISQDLRDALNQGDREDTRVRFNSNDKILKFKLLMDELVLRLESYLTKTHVYISETLKVPYPFDLLVFSALGFLLYSLLSWTRAKNEYVYNMPDDSDISSLVNNNLKEILSKLSNKAKSNESKEDCQHIGSQLDDIYKGIAELDRKLDESRI